MPNRRDFILKTAAAGGALALRTSAVSAADTQPAASKPLRVLVLGGTGFIGPHFLQAAVNRGHSVSVFLFSGEKERPQLPAGVEPLMGDRNGDLESIKNRDWDAVFDLATYVPNWVRTLGEALRGRVRHYTFISTVMTYRFPGPFDENSPTETYTDSVDPYSLTWRGKQYGALKILCEREAEQKFPGKTLVLRPGHIIGPREGVGAFTFLVARLDRGGETLAAGDPSVPVQMIDARDLAEWAVRMAEQSKTGIFNTVGPALPMIWAELLGAVRGTLAVPMTFTWVPAAWLMKRKVTPFSSLLFWGTEFGYPGFCKLSNDKARRNGLTYRPLSVTASDTLAWYKSLPVERQREVLLRFDEKNKTLEDSLARERELLAAWRTHEKSMQGKS